MTESKAGNKPRYCTTCTRQDLDDCEECLGIKQRNNEKTTMYQMQVFPQDKSEDKNL